MPATHRLRVKLNAGAWQTGGVVAALGDTVALSPDNTVGVTSYRYEIFDYPPGFTCPAGWSTDANGVYYSTAATPPDFALDAVEWGKYALRLTVNGGVSEVIVGKTTRVQADPLLIDEETAISVPSALGLVGLMQRETTQFGGVDWTRQYNLDIRALEASVAAVSGNAADWKESVQAATTAALPAYTRVGDVLTANANGAFPAIDGVTLTVGARRLLLWHGAAGEDNGTYDLTDAGSAGTPWVLTRTVDGAGNTETFTAESRVPVMAGTLHAGKTFHLTTDDPITMNVTALTFIPTTGLPDGTVADQTVKWNGTTWLAGALNLAAAAAVTGVLAVANGGTGLSALGAANTVLKVNAAGTLLEYGKLTTANLDASAGIVGTQLSATAAIAATQLAAGAAGTVLIGGASNSFSAAPTVTSLAASSYLAAGGTVATAGALRLAHGGSMQGRDNANANDRVVASWGVVATDVVNVGDANVVTRVTGSALHAYAGATQVSQLGVATSDFLKMGDVPAATGYLRVDDSWTLIQRNGNPGTADRNVIVCGGETVSVGDAAQTGNVLLRKSGCTVTLGSNYVQCLGSSQVILAAGGVSGLIVEGAQFRVNVASYRWETSVVSPKLYQNDDATNSATGDLMTLQAQNCTGTTSIGGSLVVTSGTGTTSDGAVRIAIGTESMVEACEVAAGRRIVALCRGSALTTTQMPSGTGDRVVYIENCATARSTGTPVGGGMLEVVGGDVFWINEAGVRNQLN